MLDEIAHYTTEQGLEGILKSKTLWATHWRFLNDLSETQQGMNIINDIHRDALNSMSGQDELQERIERGGAKTLRDLWFKGFEPNGNDREFFMTSLSKMPDENKDDGILSQWRSYGDNGGFAIVFSQEGLRESYDLYSKKCRIHVGKEQQNGCSECETRIWHIFGDVVYSKNPGIEEGKRKEALEVVENSASKLIDHFEYPSWGSENERDQWVKAVILLITTIKHPAFHEEKEVRFACLNRVERFGGGYHFKSPYEVVMRNNAPRLEIDFLPETIKKIIIGPQPNQDQKELAVRYYLESNGYQGVEVVKSSIPYRKNISA